MALRAVASLLWVSAGCRTDVLACTVVPGTPEMRSNATRWGRLRDCVSTLMAGSFLDAACADPVPPSV